MKELLINSEGMGCNRELGYDSNPQAAVLIGSSSSSDLEFGLQCSNFL